MKFALLGNSNSELLEQCRQIVEPLLTSQPSGGNSTVQCEAFHCVEQFTDSFLSCTTEVDQEMFDLIVVVQDYSEQFSQTQINSWLGANPLVRWVCCLGPWCESENRNYDLWPVAVCVSADRLSSRILAERAVIQGAKEPLAITASRNERYLFENCFNEEADVASLSVELMIQDPALKNYYAELIREQGGNIFESSKTINTSPDVKVFDLDPWGPAHHLLNSTGEQATPIIGLTNEVSSDVKQAMLASGVQQLIPKLADSGLLVSALAETRADSIETLPLTESRTA